MQEFFCFPIFSYWLWHQTQRHWVSRAPPLKEKWPEHKIDDSRPFGAIFAPSHIFMSQHSSTQTTVTCNNTVTSHEIWGANNSVSEDSNSYGWLCHCWLVAEVKRWPCLFVRQHVGFILGRNSPKIAFAWYIGFPLTKRCSTVECFGVWRMLPNVIITFMSVC